MWCRLCHRGCLGPLFSGVAEEIRGCASALSKHGQIMEHRIVIWFVPVDLKIWSYEDSLLHHNGERFFVDEIFLRTKT